MTMLALALWLSLQPSTVYQPTRQAQADQRTNDMVFGLVTGSILAFAVEVLVRRQDIGIKE